ncbi:PP2C family serine/threonine-protein phosphatase [Sporobolomyces koalae]|uniref:PP2C family serine/threonine-protein phosphatase n=1 Tax=Sporobolomyces koalae TaxID=500713 RepID=UPI00316DE135
MGQVLSEPETTKHTQSGADERLAWAVSEMQGWRLTMEDAHAAVLSLDKDKGDDVPTRERTSFFAVYDGHGGSTVAKFAGDTVHHRLAANDYFPKKQWNDALKRAFLETDEDLRANPDFRGDPSGCTAVGVIVTPELDLICANAGDSRSVMSVGGEAKPLSFDHKPTNAAETSRIVAGGGFVEFGRVNGNLALSRALGDFEFKQSQNLPAEQQVVTADPDINRHSHTAEDEFIVVACDGIWDVLTSQQVIDFVRLSIAQGHTLEQICENMMDRCLAPDSDWGGVGCDNMTMMVVAILGDRTQEEWYEWIKQRVDTSEPYNTPKEFVEPFAQGGNGPRGALMAGGSEAANNATGGGVVVGRAGPNGGVQGLNLGSFASGNGVGAGNGGIGDDESDDEGEELDLPTIQAALRARMAELEREEQALESGANDETSAASIEQVEDVDSKEDQEMTDSDPKPAESS